MNYSVKLEAKAERDLTAVPAPLNRRVWEGLHALGIDPTGLSKPNPPPATVGQAYEFSFLYDEMEVWIGSVFQYNADEQALHVLEIRWEVL